MMKRARDRSSPLTEIDKTLMHRALLPFLTVSDICRLYVVCRSMDHLLRGLEITIDTETGRNIDIEWASRILNVAHLSANTNRLSMTTLRSTSLTLRELVLTMDGWKVWVDDWDMDLSRLQSLELWNAPSYQTKTRSIHLPSLRRVTISKLTERNEDGYSIGPIDVSFLSNCRALERVDIRSYSAITPVDWFSMVAVPHIALQWLFMTSLGPASTARFIETLTISNCTKITDISALSNAPLLRWICLDGIRASLVPLETCPSLQHMTCIGTECPRLSHMLHLTSLVLDGVELTSDSIRSSSLCDLEVLRYSGDAWPEFDCPRLVRFKMSYSQYVNTIPHFPALQQLRLLDCHTLSMVPLPTTLNSLSGLQCPSIQWPSALPCPQLQTVILESYTTPPCWCKCMKLRIVCLVRSRATALRECCQSVPIEYLALNGSSRITDVLVPPTVKTLVLYSLHKLMKFPDLRGHKNLKSLCIRNCRWAPGSYSIDGCLSLETITVKDCHHATSLPALVNLPMLYSVSVKKCGGLMIRVVHRGCPLLRQISYIGCPSIS